MGTDFIFYRLFEISPETFFRVQGMSAEPARETAARYQFQAVEFKETSHRADGVFLPKEPELPVYFLEVQFYPLPSVFAGLLAKAYTYLKQHDPNQPYCGVVLFGGRALEPTDLAHYRTLIDAGLIRRFYLDELPELADAPVDLSILYLIRESESQAPAKARDLIARARAEIENEAVRKDVIELIETVIIKKLPRLSREEIQAMIQLHDIRDTRVYQEAKEEGLKEGEEKGLKEGEEKGRKEGEEKGRKEGRHEARQEGIERAIKAILLMAGKQLSAEEIAAMLELDVEDVRPVLAKVTRK